MPARTHNRIIIAIGVGLTLHLSLLLIPIYPEKKLLVEKPTTLQLTLMPTQEDIADPLQLKVQPVDEASGEHQSRHEVEVKNELTEEDPSNPTTANMHGPQGKQLDRDRIITAAVEAIQAQAEQPARRGFSLAELQAKPTRRYQREPLLPQLVASTINQSSSNSAGQSTDLLQGLNGKAACWQQRGIPGEAQRWFRVPLSLCGHLLNR